MHINMHVHDMYTSPIWLLAIGAQQNNIHTYTHINTICFTAIHANDPSAGSPTETLLRLLLPLSDKVYAMSYTSIHKINAAII